MQTVEHPSDKPSRMKAHRARLRASGLRPVQIWVPDVRTPILAQEAQRQSLLASRHPAEPNALTFIDHAADTGEQL